LTDEICKGTSKNYLPGFWTTVPPPETIFRSSSCFVRESEPFKTQISFLEKQLDDFLTSDVSADWNGAATTAVKPANLIRLLAGVSSITPK
jgi:hypothetical protein